MIEGVSEHMVETCLQSGRSRRLLVDAADPCFSTFGELYVSCIHPAVIKGWHRHRTTTIAYAALSGRARLVLFDDRPDSPTRGWTKEFYLGSDESEGRVVRIPPMLWNGLKGEGDETAILAVYADKPHQPDDIDRLEPLGTRIPYDWGKVRK